MHPKPFRTCGKTRMRSQKSALPQRCCSELCCVRQHRHAWAQLLSLLFALFSRAARCAF